MSELVLDVLADDGYTLTQIDALTFQLMSEIRAMRTFAVRAAEDRPTANGKSGVGQQIGTLIVSGVFSAAAIRSLRDVLVAYIERTKARAVRVRVGEMEVTVTGASRSDLAEIARYFSASVERDGAETEKAT